MVLYRTQHGTHVNTAALQPVVDRWDTTQTVSAPPGDGGRDNRCDGSWGQLGCAHVGSRPSDRSRGRGGGHGGGLGAVVAGRWGWRFALPDSPEISHHWLCQRYRAASRPETGRARWLILSLTHTVPLIGSLHSTPATMVSP